VNVVVLLLAVLAAEPEPEPAEIAPIDSSSRFRFNLSVAGGLAPEAGQLGASTELGFMALRFLRVHLDVGAAMAPSTEAVAGIFRLMGGVDGVLPLSSLELFVGLESGFTYTNLTHPYGVQCFDCVYEQWQFGPTMRIRGGIDLMRWKPFVLGFSIAYALIERQDFDFYSFGELAVRLGAVF
jgi:hypothetical protein